ncbi:hypothetical protein CPC08DRAFT_157252 [Agrocybe pediades]|nr:hypothetical protein CPC08DRAFT_157252 [Agrocybe pediades]
MAPTFEIRATERELGRWAPGLLDVWIFFNLIVNTILLPLLVATFLLSSRVKRHPTLVNVCLTWIFSGEFSLLLFYANQYKGPEPNKVLCIIQTTLLYGITPMWSVAVLMLFYYMLKAIRGDYAKKEISWPKLVVMLAAPYIAQITFSIAAFCISWNHPDRVDRAHRYFYCALDHRQLAIAMGAFTSIMCVGIVILEVHLIVIAYRNQRGLRNAGQGKNGVDFQFFLRVLVFGAFIAFGVIVNFVYLIAPTSTAPDIFAAMAGTVVFLVFGTQPDVLRVWCFWRRRPKSTSSIQVNVMIDQEINEGGSTDELPKSQPFVIIEDNNNEHREAPSVFDLTSNMRINAGSLPPSYKSASSPR